MSAEKHVVCIGTAILDCIIKGFDPVPFSETIFHADSCNLMPGGEAVNQSIAFSKLGQKVRTVCFTGHDNAGEILLKALADHNVDIRHVIRPEDAKTPVTVMIVDETGNRRSITNHSHHFNFHPEADLSCLEGACAVSLCSLFRAPFNDPAVVKDVVSEARRRNLTVYADTKLPNAGPMELKDLDDSLPFIDYIFPNEQEAAFFSKQSGPDAMADVFLDHGVNNVIIKLGEKGCFFKNRKERIILPGITVPVLDATGAGDNFAAGFITMRNRGADHETALRFANACGAVSCTAIGAAGGLKNEEQVQALLSGLK